MGKSCGGVGKSPYSKIILSGIYYGMNIFVIGGAGYIGSHVTAHLLELGHNCTVYDNLSSGLRENLFDNAQFVNGDILDYNFLLSSMKDYDAVIHLAAFKAAGESMLKPGKYAHNNICGTVNVLNAMSEAGVRNIVFSSSAAVYGEPQHLPIDENHPLNPENFYGFTKLEIERLLQWYDKLKNLRYASLRYFNAAGYDVKGRVGGLEQNPANLIPVIMETACGKRPELRIFGNDYDTQDGTCIRDYVHVSDLAAAHAGALDYITANNKSITLNLGSEAGYSVKQVLESSRKITGKPIAAITTERRAGDPAILYASSALARELINWKAQYSDIETLIQTSWNVYSR
jgi:UDP-glucose 4-epimerase